MTRSKKDLFCFFSGFAQQDILVNDYQENGDRGIILLTCQNKGQRLLAKDDYIQLDGVLFQVIETDGSSFKACSTFELANNTSIRNIRSGSKLTLGVLAEKDTAPDCLWMLHPSAANQVTYRNYSVLEGHEHTLKLDFEAPQCLESIIQPDCHLGLGGSSLTAREVSTNHPLIKFSIYCGRETREKTPFNEFLQPSTPVNITEPGAIENRTPKL